MDVRHVEKELIPKYISIGKEKFYNSLILISIEKVISIGKKEYTGTSPEIELLEFSKKLISMYRKNGNVIYLELSCVFRKASHKIYRLLLNKGLINKNNKFLNVV